ncbi:hypothetical protein JYU34_002469 [Plutella xylostella]|uniref:Uncharacterized protein n=1 Tax=Plutella xylostella TaxID=51655 RepID=A0ABQ7R2C0_PLUXY|nr:hypothetical protein JYU34_002469 [Plutella xylostella]
MGIFLVTVLLFLKYFFVVSGQEISTMVIDVHKEYLNTFNDTDSKKALRYGFQKTEACREFKLAFICVRKCRDLNYDVAKSDKNCKCTCHKKSEKGHKSPFAKTTDTWRFGAPKMSAPYWIQQLMPKVEEDTEKITTIMSRTVKRNPDKAIEKNTKNSQLNETMTTNSANNNYTTTTNVTTEPTTTSNDTTTTEPTTTSNDTTTTEPTTTSNYTTTTEPTTTSNDTTTTEPTTTSNYTTTTEPTTTSNDTTTTEPTTTSNYTPTTE